MGLPASLARNYPPPRRGASISPPYFNVKETSTIIVLMIVSGCLIAATGALTMGAGSAIMVMGLLAVGTALCVLPILRIEKIGRRAIIRGDRRP